MGSASPGHRVGLALSGGGMRAAFFHVGVIARMPEVGLLRKVDVISTVSGGAVVGALYYLKLFVRKPTSDDDHLKVAKELVRDFKRAGRHNLRARAFCNPLKNLDMLVRSGYTRSDRIGDLLDKLFFKETFKERPDAAELEDRYPFLDRQIELQELDDRNLPTFILNSTCLNTGHNWRFTPQGMGEPKLEEGTERGARLNRIDRNMRFQWLAFADASASACSTEASTTTKASRHSGISRARCSSSATPRGRWRTTTGPRRCSRSSWAGRSRCTGTECGRSSSSPSTGTRTPCSTSAKVCRAGSRRSKPRGSKVLR
jgi:Patatin-like phospholipase